MKTTIAILGDTGKFSPGLMEVLMKQDLRLLFISEDETTKIELQKKLDLFNPAAEIEFLSCEREGCWEADIIAIGRIENISSGLIQKIKEVATQKTVLVVSEEVEVTGKPDFERLLPNSRVVKIQIDSPAKEFSITGNQKDSVAGIRTIFEKAGYNYKSK